MVFGLRPGLIDQRVPLLRHRATRNRLRHLTRGHRGRRPLRCGDQRFRTRRVGGRSTSTHRRPRGPARCLSCMHPGNPPTCHAVAAGAESWFRNEDRRAHRLTFIKGARLLSGSGQGTRGGSVHLRDAGGHSSGGVETGETSWLSASEEAKHRHRVTCSRPFGPIAGPRAAPALFGPSIRQRNALLAGG